MREGRTLLCLQSCPVANKLSASNAQIRRLSSAMHHLPFLAPNSVPRNLLRVLHPPSCVFRLCSIGGSPPNFFCAFSCFSWLFAACLLVSLNSRLLAAE